MAKFGHADHQLERPIFPALPASRAMFARMAKFDLPKARQDAASAAFAPLLRGIPEALFERRLRDVLKALDGI